MAKKNTWLLIIVYSMFLYFFGVAVLAVTNNPIIFPAVAMIGSFSIPAAYVAFFYERRIVSQLRLRRVVLGFAFGSVLGLFAAALLSPLLINQLNFVTLIVVGFVEELVKIMAVIVVVSDRKHRVEINGIIIGVAVGMGFAALENHGYAFVQYLQGTRSVPQQASFILLRGLLSPIGHGTWTAILAGVMFRESASYKFKINPAVIWTFIFVSILHGLWNSLPSLLLAYFPVEISFFISSTILGLISLIMLAFLWGESKRKIEIQQQLI